MIDLHVHSTASDGSFTPSELIELAVKTQLKAIALTDHDTLSGLDSFFSAAKAYPELEVIAGVEISCSVSSYSEVHIVGLFVDPQNSELTAFLNQIIIDRNDRNLKMINLLNDLGYKITIDDLKSVSSGDSIGRPLFAKILIEKGYFKEPFEVFESLLRRGSKGYIGRKLPTAQEAINVIQNAGGIAIWAHPMYKRKNERSYVRNTLEKLRHFGLDGIETYYTVYNPSQQKFLQETATSCDLLHSGGSDFHGAFQAGISLGTGFGTLSVPDELVGKMHDYLTDKKRNKLDE